MSSVKGYKKTSEAVAKMFKGMENGLGGCITFRVFTDFVIFPFTPFQ